MASSTIEPQQLCQTQGTNRTATEEMASKVSNTASVCRNQSIGLVEGRITSDSDIPAAIDHSICRSVARSEITTEGNVPGRF